MAVQISTSLTGLVQLAKVTLTALRAFDTTPVSAFSTGWRTSTTTSSGANLTPLGCRV